jgi:hypothetical protein
MMSFLYLENIFEKFIDTLLLKTYKATIVWKDLVLSLFLFDVQSLKINKNPLLRKSKNHNFIPQLDPLKLCQNANRQNAF